MQAASHPQHLTSSALPGSSFPLLAKPHSSLILKMSILNLFCHVTYLTWAIVLSNVRNINCQGTESYKENRSSVNYLIKYCLLNTNNCKHLSLSSGVAAQGVGVGAVVVVAPGCLSAIGVHLPILQTTTVPSRIDQLFTL